MDRHSRLLHSLQNKDLYDHPVEKFVIHQTHISSIILTGPYAYKLKKPVHYDFVDFRKLQDRKDYYEEEIRLNRRLCPDLYRGVIPITGTIENPGIGTSGPVVEYAVKMIQFPQENLFSSLAEDERMTMNLVESLIHVLADFHSNIQSDPPNQVGTYEKISNTIRSNLSELREVDFNSEEENIFQNVSKWLKSTLDDKKSTLQKRRKNGFIRNCHGDVHLNNVVYHENEVKIFDCIEFNDEFRWIDVIDEIAFLVMDFESRANSKFGHRAINHYLTLTGYYDALQLFNFYRTHRALVRCKVTNMKKNKDTSCELTQEADHYLKLAKSYSSDRRIVLLLTHGLSGSGKTTFTQRFIDSHGAIRIRSDIERKRLAELPFNKTLSQEQKKNIYTQEMTQRTYEILRKKAESILQSGFPVIVDATFLKRHYREQFVKISESLDVPVGILSFQLSDQILARRLKERNQDQNAVSDADIEVMKKQKEISDPLRDSEANHVFEIRSSRPSNQKVNEIHNFFDGEK